MPDIHQGIMLPPVKYSFPPLLIFTKKRPMPMITRKYVKTIIRSKVFTDFMVVLWSG
jgi:hypothetical protein